MNEPFSRKPEGVAAMELNYDLVRRTATSEGARGILFGPDNSQRAFGCADLRFSDQRTFYGGTSCGLRLLTFRK